jgi:putative FmdB family regulatory protein
MPLFEFECNKCGKRLEVLQKINSIKEPECPKCKLQMNRLFNTPAVHFKGKGWTPQFHGMVNGGKE